VILTGWLNGLISGSCVLTLTNVELNLGKNNEQQDYIMRRHACNDRVIMSMSTLEKDLGVNIDNELKFSKHIEGQVNKANERLELISRSFELLDAEAMKQLFAAVVRLETSCGHRNLKMTKNLIESVRRRATRIVPGLKGKSYGERLKIMKLPSFSYRRLRGDLIEAYKHTHGFYKVPEGLLEFETRTNTRGHGYKLKKKCVVSHPCDNISSRFESPTCGTASLIASLTLRV
jgi:hypothetical protein